MSSARRSSSTSASVTDIALTKRSNTLEWLVKAAIPNAAEAAPRPAQGPRPDPRSHDPRCVDRTIGQPDQPHVRVAKFSRTSADPELAQRFRTSVCRRGEQCRLFDGPTQTPKQPSLASDLDRRLTLRCLQRRPQSVKIHDGRERKNAVLGHIAREIDRKRRSARDVENPLIPALSSIGLRENDPSGSCPHGHPARRLAAL